MVYFFADIQHLMATHPVGSRTRNLFDRKVNHRMVHRSVVRSYLSLPLTRMNE